MYQLAEAYLLATFIALTAMGLFCGTALLSAMIYVLPGHFTFWPTIS